MYVCMYVCMDSLHLDDLVVLSRVKAFLSLFRAEATPRCTVEGAIVRTTEQDIDQPFNYRFRSL